MRQTTCAGRIPTSRFVLRCSPADVEYIVPAAETQAASPFEAFRPAWLLQAPDSIPICILSAKLLPRVDFGYPNANWVQLITPISSSAEDAGSPGAFYGEVT